MATAVLNSDMLAHSKDIVEQEDNYQELKLAAGRHEFIQKYNDQDLCEYLFASQNEDFEFIPLGEAAEAEESDARTTSRANGATPGCVTNEKKRPHKSIWEALKESCKHL
jgi:hypothetical protein